MSDDPITLAVLRVRDQCGSEGLAGLIEFLAALPSDAMIAWGDDPRQWMPVDVLRQEIEAA